MTDKKKLRLTAFMRPTTIHTGAWRYPGAWPDANFNFPHIKSLAQTLERIDKEDYGYCDDCGVEIGIRRLEARPTATLCIDCKSLAEIKEKQLVG